MSVDRDFEAVVRAWIYEGPEQLPDPALDMALQEIAATPQRGTASALPAFPILRFAMPAAAALVVIAVVTVLTLTVLPRNSIGPPPRSTPTPATTRSPEPSTTPAPLPSVASVSGDFGGVFGSVVLVATMDPAATTGSMEVTASRRQQYTVDIRCSRSEPGGILLLGGRVTESTYRGAAEGDRVAVALRPGDPQTSIFWFEGRRRPGDCAAFLERVPDVAEFLEPIDGEFEITPSP